MSQARRLIMNTLEIIGVVYRSKLEHRKDNIDQLFKVTIHSLSTVTTEYDKFYDKYKDHNKAYQYALRFLNNLDN